jgi:D-glycero-D-manno-heptose 1,7-bisphosphate phosphatase
MMPLSNLKNHYIFLDRDGTIIEEKHYLSDYRQVKLLPGAAMGLKEFQKAGFGLIVITNQSGLGRGFFNLQQLDLIHQKMCELLADEGVIIDDILYCPHTPDQNCQCRKPETGLIQAAAEKLKFKPEDCIVIGDKPCDIELGQNIKARTILVRTGYGKKIESENKADPDIIADDLMEAAGIIVG